MKIDKNNAGWKTLIEMKKQLQKQTGHLESGFVRAGKNAFRDLTGLRFSEISTLFGVYKVYQIKLSLINWDAGIIPNEAIEGV